MIDEVHPGRPSVWDYAVCYGLWAVVLGAAFQSFWVWRTTVEVLVEFYLRRSDAFATAYTVGMLLIGLILFGAIIASEDYLRGGLRRLYGETYPYHGLRRVLRRFARIVVPLLLLTLLAVGLQEWTIRRAAAPPASSRRHSTGGLSPTDPQFSIPGAPAF